MERRLGSTVCPPRGAGERDERGEWPDPEYPDPEYPEWELGVLSRDCGEGERYMWLSGGSLYCASPEVRRG